jgi:hypothetical protein
VEVLQLAPARLGPEPTDAWAQNPGYLDEGRHLVAVVDVEPGTAERLAVALAGRPITGPPLESLRIAATEVLTYLAPALRELVQLMRANPALTARHAASFALFNNVIIRWPATARCPRRRTQ